MLTIYNGDGTSRVHRAPARSRPTVYTPKPVVYKHDYVYPLAVTTYRGSHSNWEKCRQPLPRDSTVDVWGPKCVITPHMNKRLRVVDDPRNPGAWAVLQMSQRPSRRLGTVQQLERFATSQQF